MIRFIGAVLGNTETYVRLSIAAVFVSLSLPSHAETTVTYENGTIRISFPQYSKETDADRRIDLSGKLRMLSQRVVSDACFVQSGIATTDTARALRTSVQEINDIAHALEFGNTRLGIFGAEERRKTLAILGQFNELWTPIHLNALSIAQGDGTPDDVLALNVESAALLQVSHALVATVVGQYFDPTQTRLADTMRIEIAERQQYLAQEIAKNTCLSSASMDGENAMEPLWSARMAFGSAMDALSAGMPSLGIQAPPPTSKIDRSLNALRDTWLDLQSAVDRRLSGDVLDDAQLEAVFYSAHNVTSQMGGVITMYAEQSKFGS